MMIKKLWKKNSFKIWSITSGVLLATVIAVPIVLNTALADVLDFALGGADPIFKEGEQSAYVKSYNSKDESKANADDVNVKLNEEGMVLLKNKNNALPLAKGSKISVFGKNSDNIAIGGSGSGAASGDFIGVNESLRNAGFEVNPTLENFYHDNKLSGEGRSSASGDLDSGKPVTLKTGETPQSSYTNEVKDSYKNYQDAAVIVLTRIGGEGMDLPMTMNGVEGARKSDDHYLQLDKNEEDLIVAVTNGGFKKVIVVINSGSAMELGFLEENSKYVTQKGYTIDPSKIDAAISIGYPGNSGCKALGEIIAGDVNPSGKTVDTYATDFKKMPSWKNFSVNNDFDTEGGLGDQYMIGDQAKLYYFADYEEGEYVGYRYYETRAFTDGNDWYDANVVYPFGYGLSYTTFSWSVDATTVPSTLDPTNEFTVEVEVKNEGSVAGKDVVEVYAKAPYKTGEIEKPYEILIGYAKTSLLEPGASEKVSIDINPYYMASYDYNDANNNGFKGYELDAGTYSLSFNKNSHESIRSFDMELADNYQYAEDPVTGTEVKNLYTDNEDASFNSDYQLKTILSRKDWEGTFPSPRTQEERTVSQDFIDKLDDKSTNNPNDYDNDPQFDYPTVDDTKLYTIYDLLYKDNLDADGNYVVDEEGNKVRGEWVGEVSFDDERWDRLLDQMNLAEVANMYNTAAYKIAGVDSVGLPVVTCADGPVGWTSFINPGLFEKTASYSCGVTVASTWNDELISEFGAAVGEEGLIGNGSTPYTGWYAPAMNIHRSPFGGRHFEYFSEDPLLSGKVGAAEVRGCRSKGLVTFVKHFAANEQETHRSISGDCSWITEQALREIYLRPFEITVKEGKTLGMMSSFNRIGTRWTGGDYRLLTTILRDEWGFNGAVICDFNTIPTYMDARQEAYAGGDLNLATMASSAWNYDESSIGDQLVLRRVLKDVCYSIVNANSMQGTVIGQTAPKWFWINYAYIFGMLGVILVWGGIVITLDIKKIKAEEKAESDSK